MNGDMAPFRLPASSRHGGLTLRVADLNAALEFYTGVVGFRAENRSGEEALLRGRSEHETAIRLMGSPEARRRAPRSAGLFHAAFRYPGRRELATAVLRCVRKGYPLDGAADHLVSDAVYLRDPDGNGVELYTDRPKAEWPRHGEEIAMSTEPLDLDALLAEATETAPDESGTVELGHVHLQVTDLHRSEQFYGGILGFDVTQRTFPGALFLSAGGYHHHIGMNIWSSRRGTPADPAALGLVQFTVSTGDVRAVDALRLRLERANLPTEIRSDGLQRPILVVHDPDNIGVAITV
jgi:catechol 2,3-dioxygenase